MDGGHLSLDTAANEIAAEVREFMDMPTESIRGAEIMGTATAPARFPPFTTGDDANALFGELIPKLIDP